MTKDEFERFLDGLRGKTDNELDDLAGAIVDRALSNLDLSYSGKFDGEGILCDACGQPFTDAEWGGRHDGEDGATVYHEDCCPECAIPSADDWADDFDPERLAELADDAAEAAIGGR